MQKRSTSQKTQKMVTIAMLAALVCVLQALSSVIKFGPVSITLALTPIIIGAAIYGIGTGAFLGGVFGVITYILGLIGMDGGFVLAMMGHNAAATTIICIGKGVLAGIAAAVIYKLLAQRNEMTASILAGIVTPITNTGIFAIGMLTVMRGFLSGLAGSENNPVAFLFLTMIGINFIVEFVVNVALSFAVTRVIDTFKKAQAK